MPSISYHVLIDDLDQKHIDELFEHLRRLQPDYINIKGGERFEKAMQFVERASYEISHTKCILRRWPDDGILKRYNYNTDIWFREIISPIEEWLKIYKPIWLLDNESMEDNLTQYANASATIMDIMGIKKLPVAVGRFSAGNPKERQYAQLDPIWAALKKWYGLHIWSPNEYFEKSNTYSGIGSIFRYHLGWQRCKDKFNFIPETVIGEFGLAYNYLSNEGFRKIGLDETQYYNLCFTYFWKYYAPYNVTPCLFSVGNWNGFDVSKTFYDLNKTNEVNVPIIEQSGIINSTGDKSKLYAVAIDDGIRIRQSPVNGKVLTGVRLYEQIEVIEDESTALSKFGVVGKWLHVRVRNIEGYTAAWYYAPCKCK